MLRKALLLTLALCLFLVPSAQGADKKAKDDAPWQSGDFGALSWRALGPALASGRIGDFAVRIREDLGGFDFAGFGGS